MPPRFVSQQLSRPTGLLGRVMGHLMNRHNAKMNAFAVKLLELAASDRVLEIGFGGGATLPALINGAAFVAGVDRSRDVVAWAKTRYAGAVMNGRADFREGSVEAIPFAAGSFTKVCTVNTVYFWRSLEAGFAEIHRVLSPGGRAIVGFLPKEWMDRMGHPPDIFTPRAPEDVIAGLTNSGFAQVQVKQPEATTKWNIIVATRSDNAQFTT